MFDTAGVVNHVLINYVEDTVMVKIHSNKLDITYNVICLLNSNDIALNNYNISERLLPCLSV